MPEVTVQKKTIHLKLKYIYIYFKISYFNNFVTSIHYLLGIFSRNRKKEIKEDILHQLIKLTDLQVKYDIFCSWSTITSFHFITFFSAWFRLFFSNYKFLLLITCSVFYTLRLRVIYCPCYILWSFFKCVHDKKYMRPHLLKKYNQQNIRCKNIFFYSQLLFNI